MRTPLTILVVIFVILAGLFLLSPKQPGEPSENVYPWDIDTSGDNVSVFGITLGKTPLQNLMDKLRDEGDTAIFVEENKPPTVEAYFNSVNLGGFQAKILAVVSVPRKTLEEWAAQAKKMTPQASGARKIKLTGENLEQAKTHPIIAMTYLPRVAYDENTTRQRFGEPTKITRISDNEQYWFYPHRGLILNLNAESREALHYLQPRDYEKVRRSILNSADKK